jgi:hypothetical protein
MIHASTADAQSDPNVHTGVRRLAIDAFGGAMFGARGPSIATLGARFSYAVDPHWDIDAGLGLLFAYTAQDTLLRLLFEGGTTINGAFTGPNSRIGAYGTAGVAWNSDDATMVFGLGAEVRVGAGGRPSNACGVDTRVRAGVRLFQGLNAEVPLDAVYGVELAFGLGLGGPRARVEAPDGGVRQQAIRAFERMLVAQFQDLGVARDTYLTFPVCAVNVEVTAGAIATVASDQSDDGHRCRVPVDGGSAVSTSRSTCTLYLLASGAERNDTLTLNVAEGAAPSVTDFALSDGATGMFVCELAEVGPSVLASQSGTEGTQRSLLASIPFNMPVVQPNSELTVMDTNGAVSVSNESGRLLGVMSDTTATHTIRFDAGHAPVEICVFAPAIANLQVTFSQCSSPQNAPPGVHHGSARWDQGVCCTVHAPGEGNPPPTLTIACDAPGSSERNLTRWPVLVTYGPPNTQ